MSDNTPDIVDVTDSGDTNSTPLDSSVLSGASAPDATAPTPDATAVAPTAQPITPNYSTTPLAQPTPTAPNVPSAPAPNIQAVTGTPAVPPAPQGQPSVWKNLVAGALYGLAGSAGAKHFGAGLAGGVEENLQQKQQQIENTQRQQQLNFESVQAADSHIKALAEINQANQLTDNEKLDYKQKQAEYQNFLQDNFGIEPNLSFNDSHADGIAALSTASTMNGGQIPPAAISFQPAPDGVHGTISAYSPSQQQMQQNTNGFRDLINRQRQAQGLPDIDTATFNSLGFKGQRDAAQAAITFFSPTPTFSLDKTKSDYLPVVLAQKQQQLGLYQNHKDINGTPDADPNTEQQMQASIDYLQKTWDKSNSMEAAQAQQQAGATEQGKEDVENNPSNVSKKAAAAGQVKTAEVNAEANTVQGRLNIQKTQQDIVDAQYKNADAHQKTLFDEGKDPVTGQSLNLSNAPDEFLVDGNTGQPIPTKMLSTLKPTQQESNRADFAKSTLHTLDKIDELKASGKLPNGPITGLTAKALTKAGLSGAEAQEAVSYIALAQSAATGAHVGGRFNVPIMEKMGDLLKLNMNDNQFQGAETALRSVMTPYAQQGGRETVGQFKQGLMGQTKAVNGKAYKVTGFDQNGQAVLTAQ